MLALLVSAVVAGGVAAGGDAAPQAHSTTRQLPVPKFSAEDKHEHPARLGLTLPCGALEPGQEAQQVNQQWLASAAPALDALSAPPLLFTVERPAAGAPLDEAMDVQVCRERLAAATGADAAGALLQRLGPATVEVASAGVERRGFFASEAECSPHAALEPAAFARMFEAGAWETSGSSSAVAWGATADGRGCAHVSDTFVGSLGLASALIRASLAGRPVVYRQGLAPLGVGSDLPPFSHLLSPWIHKPSDTSLSVRPVPDFFLAAAWKGLVDAAGEELVVAGPGLSFLAASRGQMGSGDALTAALLASKELVTGAAGSAARPLRVVVPYAHVGLGDFSVEVPLKELLASASPGAWRVVRREWHFTSSPASWEALALDLATRSGSGDPGEASERQLVLACSRRRLGALRHGDTNPSGLVPPAPLREGQAPWWSEWAQPDPQRGARQAAAAGAAEGAGPTAARITAPLPTVNGEAVPALPSFLASTLGSPAARDAWLAEAAARVPGGAWEAVVRVAADGSVTDVPAGAADGPLPLEALSHVLAAERGYGFVEFTLEQAAE